MISLEGLRIRRDDIHSQVDQARADRAQTESNDESLCVVHSHSRRAAAGYFFSSSPTNPMDPLLKHAPRNACSGDVVRCGTVSAQLATPSFLTITFVQVSYLPDTPGLRAMGSSSRWQRLISLLCGKDVGDLGDAEGFHQSVAGGVTSLSNLDRQAAHAAYCACICSGDTGSPPAGKRNRNRNLVPVVDMRSPLGGRRPSAGSASRDARACPDWTRPARKFRSCENPAACTLNRGLQPRKLRGELGSVETDANLRSRLSYCPECVRRG